MIYVDIPEAIAFLPILTDDVENHNKLEGIFSQFLNDASRLFEVDTQAKLNHYAKSSGQEEVRSFYGNGTSFLHIQPIQTISDVTIKFPFSQDFTLESDWYELLDNQTLYLIPQSCPKIFGYWTKSPLLYQITGVWGYSCIPEDVKVAVKSSATLMMHNAPISRLDADFVLNEQFVNSLRYSYTQIRNKYLWLNKDLKVALP